MTDALRRTKYCPGCGRTRRMSSFNADKTRKDGRCVYCKACRAVMKAAHDQSPKGRRVSKAYRHAYQLALTRLRQAHREEFARLLAEAKKEGES